MTDLLAQGIATHGPWAAFAVLLLVIYTRLVNDVISITRKNTEAFTASAEAIKQVTQVMVEVKDTIHKCRKE